MRQKSNRILCATLLAAAMVCASLAVAAAEEEEPTIAWDRQAGRIVITSGRLELVVETASGLNPKSLRNRTSGYVYADRDYDWPGGAFPQLEAEPVIHQGKGADRSIVLKGRLGSLAIEQEFTAPKDEPGTVLEEITIRNPGQKPLDTSAFKCGFAKHLRDGQTWVPDASEVVCCRIPYRRETDGRLQEFPLREVAEHGTAYASWFNWPPRTTPVWGSEGWVWGKGATSLVIAKHNAETMEWSLMEPIKRAEETLVRFGGAGQWKYGHPEQSAQLKPGQSFRFGQTRFQTVDGDWKQAFYAFRGYMDQKGCRRPKDYDPPVHWNELYDNEYFSKICAALAPFFEPGKPGFGPEVYATMNALHEKYYTLELMKIEAAKARELGCEALYLDPGWDIDGPDLHVWDAARLGSMDSFVRMIRSEYGLKGVSLWCSLGGVPPTLGDPTACPSNARVLTEEGKKADLLVCFASPGFLDTKEKRLDELCRNGAAFLMFDSNQYTGPCYDKSHGHQIPSTREEHAKALFELVRRVKTKHPHVLIEMHDPITGPCGVHYTPTYFGYRPPHSFDCLWGHEFMWNPMDDLLSGRAISLYYYNLAYSIPLYLHVNLKTDNESTLVFWWFASTCRHLGVGGKSPNPAVWDAHKKAMRTYRGLKQFYTQGEFYGLDEMLHVHTLPESGHAVLNAFNLAEQATRKQVTFRLANVGLPSGSVDLEGAPFQQKGDEVTVDLTIPARGHLLLKLKRSSH